MGFYTLNKTILVFLCCLMSFWTHQSFAQLGDVEAGKMIVMKGNGQGAIACMVCHKENGEGDPVSGFPQLAGLNATYLATQINDFKSSKRINAVMLPIAKSLSVADIQNVTAYFASLPHKEENKKSKNETLLNEGKWIAERGLWDKGVPACFSCHGPQGVGVGEMFPRIAQQNKLYLTQQIEAWQKGTRNNDPNQLMKTVAKKLNKKEINAVTEYLSSLSMEKEEVK